MRLMRYALMLIVGLLSSQIISAAPLYQLSNVTFNVTDTSEADTTGNTVAIGEVITFTTTFEIAEGTTNNVSVTANLPIGLQYVSGSVSSSVANAGWTLIPPALSGGASSGDDVTFSYSNVNNSDTDGDTEFITVNFDVVVNNESGNQDGTTLSTSVTVSGNGVNTPSSTVDVTIGEPDLSVDVQQRETFSGSTITSGDAGDTVFYRIVITNNGNAPAYDINLTDVLPLDYVDFVGAGAITTGPSAGVAITSNPSPGPFGFYWPEIQAGSSVSVGLEMRIKNATAPGESWTNTADITYTSLPGTNGTGNATPGTDGTSTGERTGADGVGGALNDYAATDTSSTFTVPDPEVYKQVEHPSQTPVVDDPSILYGNPAGTDTVY
jgi:uncharacterized repeat protein (TIGR01451 family)